MKLILKTLNLGISLLFIFAALGLAYVALPLFGNKALIARSGSMQPTIGVGDLVVVKSENAPITPIPISGNQQSSALISAYKMGDIVAFASEKNSKLITTHRIVGAEARNGKIYYQTKGDANEAADKNLVAESNIVGKAAITVPYIGKLFTFAKSKNGFLLMVIFPALMVILFELINIFKELNHLRGGRKDSSEVKSQGNSHLGGVEVSASPPSEVSTNRIGILRILLPLVLGIMFFHNSFAFFSDTETSTNNTFTAAIPSPSPSPSPTPSPTPTPGTTPGDVVINEIMWGGSDDEWIELRNTTSSTIDISNWTIENAGSGSTSINIPGSQSIGPGGLYLIAENKNTSTINIDPDHPTAAVSLLDSGEVLTLKNASSQIIDTANATPGWLAGNNSTPSIPRKTMERKDPPSDGTVTGNWQTATTHTNMDGPGPTDEFGTPKATNGL